ncbi:MATE family efflux transporter [Anaerolactibacter massiliensis]|uniref:MATE family efflux transporter n=1 Tax=Anaerolactibacter massiliensis TaxID=2044573 RepID=UPI000CFA56A7|nr:MATE family efflux transporter [Anaerolactibacter massiliensis]
MEGTKQNKMGVMPMGKLLMQMSVPLMMSLLIQSLYNIVDSMFVAGYSEEALTATTLVYPVQFLMIAVGVGTAVGMNALLSRRIGQKWTEEACQAAGTGLIIVLAESLVFCLLGVFAKQQIAAMLTDDPDLMRACLSYLSINLVWCWGLFLQTYAQRLLQAVGDTVLSMISLIIGAAVNIVLDPIMIFGYFGCPEMGVAGAAAALLFNRFRNPVIHVHLKGYVFRWQDVKDNFRVSFPTIIMQAIGAFMNYAANWIMLGVSSTAVATFGVYYKLQNFLMMPMNGLRQAAIPIAGYNLGAGNGDRIVSLKRILTRSAIVFALAGTAVFMAVPAQLLSLFSASGEMLAYGFPVLRIISVTFVFSTLTIAWGYLGSGLGNGVISMIAGFLRQLGILIPLMYVLTKFAGLPWTWFAFWAAEGAAFLYTRRAIQKEVTAKAEENAFIS